MSIPCTPKRADCERRTFCCTCPSSTACLVHSVPLESEFEEHEPDDAAAVVPCQPEQPDGVPSRQQEASQQAQAPARAAATAGSQGDMADDGSPLRGGSHEPRPASKLRRLRRAQSMCAADQQPPRRAAGGAQAAALGAACGLDGPLHSVRCERDGGQGAAVPAAAGAGRPQHGRQPVAGTLTFRLPVPRPPPHPSHRRLLSAVPGTCAGRKRGSSLVGQKVEVFWEEDDEWYPGRAALYVGDQVGLSELNPKVRATPQLPDHTICCWQRLQYLIIWYLVFWGTPNRTCVRSTSAGQTRHSLRRRRSGDAGHG
jgi:hypothetical protein